MKFYILAVLSAVGYNGALASLPKNNVFVTVNALPKFSNMPLNETSISGFSSGGSFANQMQIAYSSVIKGIGAANSGQYACVLSHRSILRCMGPSLGLPPNSQFAVVQAQVDEANGKIDALSNLQGRKMIVISGNNDYFVNSHIQTAQFNSLNALVGGPTSNIKFQSVNGGHNFYTDFSSLLMNPICSQPLPPWIANCHFDEVKAILTHIYGPLNPRNDNRNRKGKFLKFPQSAFYPNPSSIGLGETGYLYVPQTCEDPANRCRLHIALHGCVQSNQLLQVGQTYVTETGYAEWADTNNFVVAFPQAVSKFFGDSEFNNFTIPVNDIGMINACWDMFGMYDPEYYNKNGRQMQAMRNLIDLLTV